MLSAEKKLQTDIKKYLKSKGCYVLITRGVPGIPDGCPDILFFCEGFWGAIEVKAAENSVCQPLQEPTLKKLNDWSWAKKVYPENWLEVRAELDNML